MEVVRQHEAWKYLPWLSPQHVDVILYRILDCDNAVSITKKWDCHLTQQHVF
jgi:hypothetical protein